MNRMSGDEHRHAARKLYADLIDDHGIRHPNYYCCSILLSLLDVIEIMGLSCPSPITVASPLLCRLHCTIICKALCFLMEAEQVGRTRLHCELWLRNIMVHSYYVGSTGQQLILYIPYGSQERKDEDCTRLASSDPLSKSAGASRCPRTRQHFGNTCHLTPVDPRYLQLDCNN